MNKKTLNFPHVSTLFVYKMLGFAHFVNHKVCLNWVEIVPFSIYKRGSLQEFHFIDHLTLPQAYSTVLVSKSVRKILKRTRIMPKFTHYLSYLRVLGIESLYTVPINGVLVNVDPGERGEEQDARKGKGAPATKDGGREARAPKKWPRWHGLWHKFCRWVRQLLSFFTITYNRWFFHWND